MKQEDKNLLLQDLCARLPYGVKCSHPYGIGKLESIAKEEHGIDVTFETPDDNYYSIDDCKPYLFPMSSMTEEQKKFFKDRPIFLDSENELVVKEDFFGNSRFTMLDDWLEVINWCYENHFDIYGLIPMGLAMDATNLNVY